MTKKSNKFYGYDESPVLRLQIRKIKKYSIQMKHFKTFFNSIFTNILVND